MKRYLVWASALLVVFAIVGAAMVPVAFAQDTTGDRVVMGENYTLQSGDTLDGNLAVLGGNATLEEDTLVTGDVTLAGGNMVVSGRVGGNLTMMGGSLTLNDTAVIEGNLAAFAGSVTRAPGAQVQGETFNGLRTPNRIGPIAPVAPVVPRFDAADETPRSWFGRFIGWQLGTLGSIVLMGLLGLVLVVIAPRGVARVASATATQPALTFGVGFLTLIVGLLAGLILLIACGLGLLVWLALLAGTVLGWIGVAVWVGQRLLGALKLRTASSIGEVLAGVVAVTLLSRIPCIGWLFGIIFVCWGLGAVVLTRFGTQDSQGPTSQPRVDGTLAPVAPAAAIAAAPSADVNAPATASARMPMTAIAGITPELSEKLRTAGIRSVWDIAHSHPAALAEATGVPVGQIMVDDWIGQAQRLVG
jgi:predicted flap endonuclease-1-like 5' DNA nuclease